MRERGKVVGKQVACNPIVCGLVNLT